MHIRLAASDADILQCWPAIYALRPHLKEENLVALIRRQQNQGYQLAFVDVNGTVPSIGGFRLTEHLAWGKAMYIDDLSTLAEHRGLGYAGALLDWLFALAKENGCEQVHLDSGHHRHTAHRLYLNKGFSIVSHHFSIVLKH